MIDERINDISAHQDVGWYRMSTHGPDLLNVFRYIRIPSDRLRRGHHERRLSEVEFFGHVIARYQPAAGAVGGRRGRAPADGDASSVAQRR